MSYNIYQMNIGFYHIGIQKTVNCTYLNYVIPYIQT